MFHNMATNQAGYDWSRWFAACELLGIVDATEFELRGKLEGRGVAVTNLRLLRYSIVIVGVSPISRASAGARALASAGPICKGHPFQYGIFLTLERIFRIYLLMGVLPGP